LNYYPIKAGVCSNIDFILKRIWICLG
jgi:hypothetical protein